MPLMKSKKAPVDAGPQDPSLAVAYAVKRKAPKKMAKGGPVSAATEKRPMPETKANDAHMVDRAPKPKMQSIPAPSMAQSKVIKSSPVDALGRKIPNLMDLDPMKHEGMSEDKGPAEQEFMDDEMQPQYAEGGMIDDMDQPEPEAEQERHASIAAAIMAKKAMMAEGGIVEHNNKEQPNGYYARNEAVLKEDYNEDMEDMSQPMDSNEHGDDIESDKHDMISMLRAKIKKMR